MAGHKVEPVVETNFMITIFTAVQHGYFVFESLVGNVSA